MDMMATAFDVLFRYCAVPLHCEYAEIETTS